MHYSQRFEILERGKGRILVIDDNGYVYDSGMPLGQQPQAKQSSDQAEAIQQLEAQVKALQQRLDAMTIGKEVRADNNSRLFQNVPNPFGKETSVDYYVYEMQTSAAIVVFDMSGKELLRYPINKGYGAVTINGTMLSAGMYLYSLVVDGREIDTKRMVITR